MRSSSSAGTAPEKGSTNDKKLIGAGCGVSRLDNLDLIAAGAQTQLEPKNQIGQLFGRQPDDGRIGRTPARKRLGMGCADMRGACSQLAASSRGAGRSMHSGPRCSKGARRRAPRPTALAWAVGRRVREAACAAVNMHAWAASAR